MDIPKDFLEFTKGETVTFATRWTSLLNRLYRYRLLLARRWWVLLLTTSLGLGAAAWWASIQAPQYISVARMMVSGKVSIPEGATYSEELANFFGTQVELMRSGEVRRRAQERVQALRPDLQPAPVSLDVGQLRGAAIFNLTAASTNPVYPQLFLDACMDEYINSKREIRSEKSETTVVAITNELVGLEKELRAGEQELLDFQKKNNVGFLQEEGNSAANYLVSLNRQIANLRTEYDLLKLLDLDQNLDRVQKNAPGTAGASEEGNSVLSSFGPEAEYLKAKQQVELLRAQRAEWAKELRPAHPTMVQLDEEIAKLETLIATFRSQSMEQLKTRREAIFLQLQNLEEVAKQWEAKAVDVGQRMAEYERNKAKLDRTKAVYERLVAGLRSVDVTQRIDQDLVSILEKASPPVSMRPGVSKMIFVGLGMGLLVGLLILAIIELIDDRVTSFPQLQGALNERLLAQVPEVKHDAEDLPPLCPHDPRHALAESFRALRSSIFYLRHEAEPPKTFLITSAVPNEGKSLIAMNFAITMALGDARVLLIDADMRRGNLHSAFGLKNDRGLGDVLKAEAPLFDCIQHTALGGLDLLSRGSMLERCGEVFLSKRTDHLLALLGQQYDYIIADTAPVMVADDTASLAPKFEACLYVVRFAFSSLHVSRKGLEILKERQTRILGVVCNQMHAGMPEYYYHYQFPEYYGNQINAGV